MRPTPRPLMVLVMSTLLLLTLVVPAAASTDTSAESWLVSAINRERTQRGLPALRVKSDLTAVARRHSARMADRGALSHNGNLGNEVGGWRKLGENVGMGPSPDRVHGSFMSSSDHRGNILSSTFTEVGVGVERRGDTIWVTEVFRQPDGSSAPPPQPEPEPAPEPAPKPKPAPKPEPAPEPAPKPAPEPTRTARPAETAAPEATPEPELAPIDRTVVTLARIEVVEDHQDPDEAFDLG